MQWPYALLGKLDLHLIHYCSHWSLLSQDLLLTGGSHGSSLYEHKLKMMQMESLSQFPSAVLRHVIVFSRSKAKICFRWKTLHLYFLILLVSSQSKVVVSSMPWPFWERGVGGVLLVEHKWKTRGWRLFKSCQSKAPEIDVTFVLPSKKTSRRNHPETMSKISLSSMHDIVMAVRYCRWMPPSMCIMKSFKVPTFIWFSQTHTYIASTIFRLLSALIKQLSMESTLRDKLPRWCLMVQICLRKGESSFCHAHFRERRRRTMHLQSFDCVKWMVHVNKMSEYRYCAEGGLGHAVVSSNCTRPGGDARTMGLIATATIVCLPLACSIGDQHGCTFRAVALCVLLLHATLTINTNRVGDSIEFPCVVWYGKGVVSHTGIDASQQCTLWFTKHTCQDVVPWS
jgi:hypothetical protein